jgi:hypothetical protein
MGIMSTEKTSERSKFLLSLLLIPLFPVLIVAVLLYFLWGATLYLAIWLTWRKQFVVFVYSNSPTWKDFIETDLLPSIRDRAVILNWSERRNWRNTLAVLAFRYFGGYRNFNPLGLVVPRFRRAKTYRFFEAFKEFKHGNPEKVEKIKQEFLKILNSQNTRWP